MSTTTRKNPNAISEYLDGMKKLEEKEIAVGFPRGLAQAYPDGTSVAEVAAKQCFGIGVPVRDFMKFGEILISKDSVIKECLEGIVKHSNKPDVGMALANAAGQKGVSLIQEAILTGDWVPNAPSTIAAKGSDKPLIDTSHMKNSVTYVIRGKTV